MAQTGNRRRIEFICIYPLDIELAVGIEGQVVETHQDARAAMRPNAKVQQHAGLRRSLSLNFP